MELVGVAPYRHITCLMGCRATIWVAHDRSTVVGVVYSTQLCGLLIQRLQVEGIIELRGGRVGCLGGLGVTVWHTVPITHHGLVATAHLVG